MRGNTLAAALKPQPTGSPNSDLVANYTATCVYSKTSWLGRFWKWFYRIHDYFFEGKELNNLKKVLDYIGKQTILYQKFIQNQPVDGAALAKARVALYTFYQATQAERPFLPLIQVESFTKTPFPVKWINEGNEKEIRRWVQKLNKSKVPIRILHEAFSLFKNGAQMEQRLSLTYPELFIAQDPEHMAFRSALKEGDSIRCNQKILTLGNQIGKKTSGFDRQVYFEIKEEPDKLLYFGVNRALPGIRQVTIQKHAWGIEPASVIEIDSEGKCAILERLPQPIPVINNVQEAAPIINWLLWLKEEGFMPHDLQPKYYMFDKENVMRSTRPMGKVPYDVPALINFMKQATTAIVVINYLQARLLT